MKVTRFLLLAFLPILSFTFTSCDSTDHNEEEDRQLESNSFKAVVSGSDLEEHTLEGSLAVQGETWSGGAFIFDLGDIDDRGDSDIDDEFILFSLHLAPSDNGPLDFSEHLNINYLGTELEPGSYELGSFAMRGDGTDYDPGNFEGVFVASYFKSEGLFGGRRDSTLDGDLETYNAARGRVILTEVTEDKVIGSFIFEADECFCYNFGDLFDVLMDLEDRDRRDPGDIFDILDDFTIEKQLNAEGDFNVDLRTWDDFDFDRREDGDGVRIRRR